MENKINIAYCIICHKNTKILKQNVSYLSKSNHVFIHIDKKSNIKDFKEYFNTKNISIIKERYNIKWGHFNQIRATIALMKATTRGKYDRIFIISGDCLVTKKNEEIYQLLIENQDKEFVGVNLNTTDEEIKNKIRYKYPSFWFKRATQRTRLNNKIRNFQIKNNLFSINKYYKFLPNKLYKGCNWFGITSNLRDYILEYIQINSNYLKAFKHSYCGDEIFFHTIICNSSFKKNIYLFHNRDEFKMCLRYIDWNSGPDFPKILNQDDYNKIIDANSIFARKFDNNLNIEYYKKIFIEN